VIPTGDRATTTPAPGPATPVTYPATAAAYSQAFLAAIVDGDRARVGAFAKDAAMTTAVMSYHDRDGQWKLAGCQATGGAQSTVCVYYNLDIDVLQVYVDSARLGGPHAVASFSGTDGNQVPSDAGGYVGQFVDLWRLGSDVAMRVYATTSTVKAAMSRYATVFPIDASTPYDVGGPAPCPGNSVAVCVPVTTRDPIRGGSRTTYLTVDLPKILSHKPNGIVGIDR
jgi:hypothetical protein